MQTRLDRMIQDSVSETSQPETQQLLATLLSELDPVQHTPILDPEGRPGLRPGVLATAVGGDLDSEQLAVSGTTGLLRSELSGNTPNPQPSGLSGLAEPARRDHAGGVAGRPEPVALHPELTMNTSVSTGATEVASADTYDVQPRQVVYVPKSKGFSTQTLIPLQHGQCRPAGAGAIEQQHGDIDAYLATRLGYGSVSELHQYFSAEQVDASASGHQQY